DLFRRLLDATARLLDGLARLQHLRRGRGEDAAGGLARVPLLGPAPPGGRQRLGAGWRGPGLEAADDELLAIDGAVRLLERLDETVQVLGADVGLQQRFLDVLRDQIESLRDRQLARLGRADLAPLR